MIIAKTDRIQERADYIRTVYNDGVLDAMKLYDSFEGTDEEKIELWNMLESWIRSAIKRERDVS